MNILQIKPLAERFGCTIDIVQTTIDDGDQVVVSKGEQSQLIGSVSTVSDMTRGELQRIFESVSGTSLREWWTGSEARR